MTQEELRNKLEVKIAIWITKGLGNKEGQGTKMLDDMVSLVNQHVKEVIGEDEEGNPRMMMSIASAGNILRAEQRKRAGL